MKFLLISRPYINNNVEFGVFLCHHNDNSVAWRLGDIWKKDEQYIYRARSEGQSLFVNIPLTKQNEIDIFEFERLTLELEFQALQEKLKQELEEKESDLQYFLNLGSF